MKNLHFFLPLLLILFFESVQAQVGIGTTTPNASAALDINSTTRGLLLPRMSRTERNSIPNPIAGLVIWCIDCGGLGQMQVFNGSGWTDMLGGVPAGLTIGDPYGGGKVGYIFQIGDPGYVEGEVHGIITTASHQSTGATWGCLEIFIGETSTTIGSGQPNTTAIISECNLAGIAARICDDLIHNGYDDWYLPSKDELNKLWLNHTAIGGWASAEYWTSSENNTETAHVISFVNGYQAFNFKAYTSYVRAVRSF